MLLVGAGLWLVTAAVGLGLAEPMVRLVARDPEVVALGADFVRIAFPFVATAVFSQLATAVLLGAGDSYTPMLASFVTTPLALFFEWVFAFGHFGLPALGMSGIALGGGLGGLAGSWLLARALLRGEGRVHLSLAALRPDPAALREVLRFSWQPSLHMVARTGITFFFMALAGRLGGDVQAAYTIGQRVEMLAFMMAFPIANACATLVGQNLGAGSLPRAWRAIWVSAGGRGRADVAGRHAALPRPRAGSWAPSRTTPRSPSSRRTTSPTHRPCSSSPASTSSRSARSRRPAT